MDYHDLTGQENMSTTALVILIIFAGIILVNIVNLFTMTMNDFIESYVKRFLWLWLPFHAFKRLTKEMREKYKK